MMPVSVEFVHKKRLWELFEETGYQAKVETGELHTKILYNRPSHPNSKQPEGTRSQRLGYYDRDGNEVAVVHQFVLPDNTLGASGKPDPKRVLVGTTVYMLSDELGSKWKVSRLR